MPQSKISTQELEIETTEVSNGGLICIAIGHLERLTSDKVLSLTYRVLHSDSWTEISLSK